MHMTTNHPCVVMLIKMFTYFFTVLHNFVSYFIRKLNFCSTSFVKKRHWCVLSCLSNISFNIMTCSVTWLLLTSHTVKSKQTYICICPGQDVPSNIIIHPQWNSDLVSQKRVRVCHPRERPKLAQPISFCSLPKVASGKWKPTSWFLK